MVGTIGGRTGVANNQQIVQSIAQGVYRATVSSMNQMFSAMASLANFSHNPRMDIPDLIQMTDISHYSD